MIGFLIFIHTLVSILLIGIILMQSSQGSGLSGTFGGNTANTVLGGQNAGNILSKITSWLASIFIILAIFISTLSGPAEMEVPQLLSRRQKKEMKKTSILLNLIKMLY